MSSEMLFYSDDNLHLYLHLFLEHFVRNILDRGLVTN